jgi:hypothetical protein
MQTPLAEGQRIHYNFVKPHQALDGETPAQVAGTGVEGKNRWMALLKKTLSPENRTMAVAGIGLLFIGLGVGMIFLGYNQKDKWLGRPKWLAWALLPYGAFYVLLGVVLTLS